ncbi:MAG: alkyl sulfatase dimerization domain-containing protein [Pseudomonadota bacterium]
MPHPVFPATAAANAAQSLPAAQEAEARRGHIAPLPRPVLRADGGAAWDPAWFDFLDGPCPASVHPALWQHAQLNAIHGLFEVCPGVWQLRGCDYANMTLIEGATGWIVVDPLMTVETSAAALRLANETLGASPVSAVLVTHCHPDHFAGIRGVIGDEDWPPIYAPEHFTAYAASEGVLGGNAMARRATYQFGLGLPWGPEGLVDGGIGKTPGRGTRGFAPPSETIRETGERREIDGVTVEFLMASGTEAPAEFAFYLPAFRVLCMAEVTCQTMHNLLPPRGAEVRDARVWARCIDEAITRFAGRTDILINCHNWPVWGQDAARQMLEEQRDLYKYTHDQTLRLANLGHGPDAIAAQIAPPKWTETTAHGRGFYGDLAFNARATYQKYFGAYDGNPVHLGTLPPDERAARTVKAMGGPDAVLTLAQEAIAEDALQWAAELLHHLIRTPGAPEAAQALLADVHANLGYRQQSGIFRNAHLRAAQELSEGIKPLQAAGGRNAELAAHLTLTDWFDAMALRLNPDRAEDMDLTFDVSGRCVHVSIQRQTEFARIGATEGPVIPVTQPELEALAAGTADPHTFPHGAELARYLAMHDSFDMWFPLATA